MNQTTAGTIEFVDPKPMRLHPLHKCLPEPAFDSPEWHGFVMGLSGAGPTGIPPIVATPEGLIMDGGRRWRGAKQLQWESIGVVRQAEERAAVIVLESLLGQRHLSKGAKVYLALGFMEEFVASAERRRLANLRSGTKTLEKPLIFPKRTQCASGVAAGREFKNLEDLAARLGVSARLLDQAMRVHRLFGLAANHVFEFQDGSKRTLKGHFEPRMLDAEQPMGLGEVLKGCGWFVDEEGNPKKQAGPPERNSYLHYFESAWGNFNKQFGRWEKLKSVERARALELVTEGVKGWPEEVLGLVVEEGRRALKGARH